MIGSNSSCFFSLSVLSSFCFSICSDKDCSKPFNLSKKTCKAFTLLSCFVSSFLIFLSTNMCSFLNVLTAPKKVPKLLVEKSIGGFNFLFHSSSFLFFSTATFFSTAACLKNSCNSFLISS